MIERLRTASYRTKNLLLLGAVLLVGYLSWSGAIGSTLSLYQEIEGTRERIEKADGAASRIAELRGKLSRMQQAIGEEKEDGTAPQQRLLERVEELCDRHGLRIHSVPAPHLLQREELFVRSFFIEVQGDLKGLLELVHRLETGTSNVSSVTFYSKKEPRTQKTRLYGRILVQHVERA